MPKKKGGSGSHNWKKLKKSNGDSPVAGQYLVKKTKPPVRRRGRPGPSREKQA